MEQCSLSSEMRLSFSLWKFAHMQAADWNMPHTWAEQDPGSQQISLLENFISEHTLLTRQPQHHIIHFPTSPARDCSWNPPGINLGFTNWPQEQSFSRS